MGHKRYSIAKKYESMGFKWIGTGGGCDAFSYSLDPDGITDEDPPAILITKAEDSNIPRTVTELIWLGIYTDWQTQVGDIITEWNGEPLTSKVLFDNLDDILKHARQEADAAKKG